MLSSRYVVGIHSSAGGMQDPPAQDEIAKPKPQGRMEAARPGRPSMGVHATQVKENQERSRAQKERAKHQCEDAKQGTDRA